MATSRALRFACIAAVAGLGLTLAYWLVTWGGGPVWVEPMDGHDGGLCRMAVANGQRGVAYSAPCGVSFTVPFAFALVGILAALVLGSHALLRDSARTARAAAWVLSFVGGAVSWETAVTYTGDGFADGLGPVRGPVHLLVVFFAAGMFFRFARAPRNPESAGMASSASE